MTADELVRIWPERWPRPDPDNTVHNATMVKKFGRDFEYRELSGITREEAREWALANRQTARYVRTMLNDAVADGLLAENPFSALRLPKLQERQIVVPTIAQIQGLCDCARGRDQHWLASMIWFSAHVGVRLGEQRAILQPGDGGMGNPFVDAVGQRSRLSLRRAQIDWQRSRSERLKPPKTKRGVRPVLVPEPAREAVSEALRHHQGKSGFLWEIDLREHGEGWSKLRREAGIWIRWHDLRHHAATWFLNHGATVDDVARQLGCKPEEVRNRYGHPDAEKALSRLEGLVDG